MTGTMSEAKALPTEVSRGVTRSIFAVEASEGKGATVRRSIGTSALKYLDPFLMLDHFQIGRGAGFPDHPHRGQATVTYMLSGKVQHNDFYDNMGLIGPGDLQWMIAGKGIVHAEMPLYTNESDPTPTGLQLWIDLPSQHKLIEPSYQELRSQEIPKVQLDNGALIKVISGGSHGIQSPVRHGNVKYGTAQDSKTIEAFHTVVLSSSEDQSGIEISNADGQSGARLILIAGEPLNQPVVQHGPFVMNTQEEIIEAFHDYQTSSNGFERALHWRSSIAN